MGYFTVRINADETGVHDLTGNTLELALSNNPTYTEQSILSPTGRAIGFDSTRRYKIMRQSSIASSAIGDYTISYWVKFDSFSGDFCVICFNSRLGSTEHQNTRFQLDNITAYIMSPSFNGYIGEKEFNKNIWYHIACTCYNNTLRFFINGDKIYESSLTSTPSFWSSSNYYFEVGGGSADRNYYLNGYLDDMCAIQGMAVWTNNFTPPKMYLYDYLTKYYAYKDPNEYLYGYK